MRLVKERLYDISVFLMLPFLGLLLIVCIGGTQHNIVWYKELLVTAAFCALIVISSLLLLCCEKILERCEKKLLVLFLAGMGIALYAVFEFTNTIFPPPFLIMRFAACSERQ